MIKRGSKEAIVLSYVQHRPDESVAAVAKKLKLRASTVRRSLQKFRQSDLIHRIPVINYQKLGFSEYSIFISLKVASQELRERFVAKCIAEHCVTRVEEFGGDFEYCVSFLAKNPQEVSAFLESFGNKIGTIIANKSISILESYTGLGRRYFTNAAVTPIVRIQNQLNEVISIDSNDKRILTELSINADRSHREIAQALSLSESTLSFRIQKLLTAGVIQSFIYGVRSRLLGCSRFRFLVYATAVTTTFRNNFEEFLINRTEVVNYSRLLGAADFIVQAEVFESHEAFLLAQDLRGAFPDEIHRISILPLFGFRKNTSFPFKTI